MTYKIPLFDSNFDDREVEAVASTVRSGWISMGRKVQALETNLAERLEVPHVVGVSSCTAALHLAMVVSGIGPGDEVIVPSMTFVATANAVRYVGAKPVFADISGPGNPTLDPQDVEERINERTRAIVPMHYAGFSCDMSSLLDVARRHELRVIEDSAHAIDVPSPLGKLGTLGDIGCFSLFANKVITSAEGGFLAVRSPEIAEKLRWLRSHGMTSGSLDRVLGRSVGYDVVELGFNYRMDDIRASLGLAQLEKVDSILQRRADLRREYLTQLSDVPQIQIPFGEHPGPSANYIFPIVLENSSSTSRDQVRESLKEAGIQTSVHYPAAHRFSIYDDEVSLEKTEAFADSEISLPFFDKLTSEQVSIVADAVREWVTGS